MKATSTSTYCHSDQALLSKEEAKRLAKLDDILDQLKRHNILRLLTNNSASSLVNQWLSLGKAFFTF